MFSSEFQNVIRLADQKLDDNFEGSRSQYPVLFGPVPTKFSGWSKLPTGDQVVQLKSIRQPKFLVEYQVPVTGSVYSVKERLLTDPNCPINSPEYSPLSIKLLLKSKVIPDTKQLVELPSLSFTVMLIQAPQTLDVPLPLQIYWGQSDVSSKGGSENQENTGHSKAQSDAQLEPVTPKKQKHMFPGVNDQFWKDVEKVAAKYVENPEQLVESLKIGYAPIDLD